MCEYILVMKEMFMFPFLQKWLEDKEEQQQAQALSDEPKLKLNDIGEKLGALDREVGLIHSVGIDAVDDY